MLVRHMVSFSAAAVAVAISASTAIGADPIDPFTTVMPPKGQGKKIGDVGSPPRPTLVPPLYVFFDWNSAKLREGANPVLRQVVNAYRAKNDGRILVTGHSDSSGSSGYNMDLARRRGEVVKEMLVSEGIPSDAITVVSRGDESPLVATHEGVREPQNRRVEIQMSLPTAIASNDAAYCMALSAKYRQMTRGADPTAEGGNALAQCQAGNPQVGIPVLERLLMDSKVPLPPRQ